MAFSDDYGYMARGPSVSVWQRLDELARWHEGQQPVSPMIAEQLRENYKGQLRDFYRHFFGEPDAHYEESLRVYEGLDLGRNSSERLYTTGRPGHILEDLVRVCEDDGGYALTGLMRGSPAMDPISYFESAWMGLRDEVEDRDIILVGLYKNMCDSVVGGEDHRRRSSAIGYGAQQESLQRARHYANMGLIYTLPEDGSDLNLWELKLELKGLKEPSAELDQAYEQLSSYPSAPLRFLYLYDVVTCTITQDE